jgi:hypothetical protein
MTLALFDRFPNQNPHCLPKDKLYAPDTDSQSFCSSRTQHGNAAKNHVGISRHIGPPLFQSIKPKHATIASICHSCKVFVTIVFVKCMSQAKLDNATFCEKVLFAIRQKLHLAGLTLLTVRSFQTKHSWRKHSLLLACPFCMWSYLDFTNPIH